MFSTAVFSRGFFESHVSMPLPAHLEDLANKDDSTPTGRLLGAAIMLASINLSVALFKFAVPAIFF